MNRSSRKGHTDEGDIWKPFEGSVGHPERTEQLMGTRHASRSCKCHEGIAQELRTNLNNQRGHLEEG